MQVGGVERESEKTRSRVCNPLEGRRGKRTGKAGDTGELKGGRSEKTNSLRRRTGP